MSTEMLVEEKLQPEERETIDTIIAAHRNETGALIPVLQEVQGEFGFLSQPVLRAIAENMKIPFSEVTGVVTFYSFFNTSPRGKHAVRVCMGTACYVRNGKQVLADLEKELGVKVGETTEDRNFTLEIGRCFGACGLAPVLMVDDDVHQRVKSARLKELLAPYRAEGSNGEDKDSGEVNQ